jgi:SAM-dependent methyltransferase
MPPDHLTRELHAGSAAGTRRIGRLLQMDDWIDYYDSTHTIYASKLHRDLHFRLIANDIIGYISSPDAVVLDYACGEALAAADVAKACGKLILAEPAPGVRGRLIARFAPNTKIRVRSLEDLRNMTEKSVDLVVMNSVAQYMTPDELDAAFSVIKRLLRPGGRLVLGDILRPEVGMARDVLALLRFALKHGFLRDALIGLVSTALSDYRHLRTRVGLQRYSEKSMIAKLAAAGFTASRAHFNIGHNPWRMTFVARLALSVAAKPWR